MGLAPAYLPTIPAFSRLFSAQQLAHMALHCPSTKSIRLSVTSKPYCCLRSFIWPTAVALSSSLATCPTQPYPSSALSCYTVFLIILFFKPQDSPASEPLHMLFLLPGILTLHIFAWHTYHIHQANQSFPLSGLPWPPILPNVLPPTMLLYFLYITKSCLFSVDFLILFLLENVNSLSLRSLVSLLQP